jgi:hypothetical protein
MKIYHANEQTKTVLSTAHLKNPFMNILAGQHRPETSGVKYHQCNHTQKYNNNKTTNKQKQTNKQTNKQASKQTNKQKLLLPHPSNYSKLTLCVAPNCCLLT